MKTANSKQMRDADGEAIHVLGIPSTLLMTNAAKELAKAASAYLGPTRSAVVFCGGGNNGGDGICAASLLLRRGWAVRCLFTGRRDKMSPDCAEMARRLIELGGRLEDFDPRDPGQREAAMKTELIIDAVFGIGLNSELRGLPLAAVELMNASPAPVISADIPTGVEADTGRVLGSAVRADMTVTFSMAKPGHFVEPGCAFRGRLLVADIGVPRELLSQADSGLNAVIPEEIRLPRRPRVSYKGDYGRLLIAGGSAGLSGAPALCAEAAARSGAGLISLGVPKEIYQLTASRMWEVMCFPLADDGSGRLSELNLPILLDKLAASDVGVIGCGLSRSRELDGLVRAILWESETPLVIDADGLFALGSDPETILRARRIPVLTPHEGEFLRLGGRLTGDRAEDARRFAQERNCVLVLKGHHTICAYPDGTADVIAAGNPGMAKGGSGDVLAGLIGGLMCQLPQKQAVTAACAIHAWAGDLCAERLGEYSMLPRDLIQALPGVMKDMTEAAFQGKD